MKHYWFKPKQFWKWCAAYYPVTWQGWLITIACTSMLLSIVRWHDVGSPSVSNTLMSAAPWILLVLMVFDLISFRTGEYPSWWKKRMHKR